jgi:hypothetical protein
MSRQDAGACALYECSWRYMRTSQMLTRPSAPAVAMWWPPLSQANALSGPCPLPLPSQTLSRPCPLPLPSRILSEPCPLPLPSQTLSGPCLLPLPSHTLIKPCPTASPLTPRPLQHDRALETEREGDP